MKVKYFAWLRERLNRDEDHFDALPEGVSTVADLIVWMRQNDEAAALAFENPKIIRAAVDEELVDHDTSIINARTVALFPPMTGG